MKVITFCNSKGGVGKTTSTFCIGSILQAKGFKVLYIDTDSQRNLTCFLKGNIQASKNIYTLMKEETSINESTQITPYANLIGASYNLDLLKLEGKNKPYILKEKLKEIKNKYDFILIDTPPHFNDLVINGLVASDYVIVSSTAEIGAFMGIDTTLSNIKAIQPLNNNLKVLGVLITCYNPRAKAYEYLKEESQELCKRYNTSLFNTYIRRNIALMECEIYKEPINKYAPNSNGYKDYLRLCDEILRKIKKEGGSK